MAAGILYTYPEKWRAFKALIAAQYSGAQIHVLSTPPYFHFGQTNCTPEFLQKFPAGQVPAFEGDDGFCVFESNAIAHYVSNDDLRGSTPEAAAQLIQWVSFADSDIVPPASTCVFPTLSIMHHNKQATENTKQEVRQVLGLLNARLKTRTFLVGERVTLADLTAVCTLSWLYNQVLEPSFQQAFPNTNHWLLTCIHQPQSWAVLGEVKLWEKMEQLDIKKFAESQPKKEVPRKEKGEREEKPKAQAERKEKKAAVAPCPEEEMDECDQALAAEPKAKDPFVHLPKSTFVLDEFKRKCSNEDTLTVALPYFWEHFDRDSWSLWYVEYPFPQELSQTFVSCNLIAGMFQHLEKLRKNAFASVTLSGTNNSSTISGVWVFQGQKLAFLPSPDWQTGGLMGICSVPALAKICQKIEQALNTTLPFEDVDGDKFSVFPTLRGFSWRGRDCDDRNRNIYPGRRPENWDAQQDSNCNGIWGTDPKDGVPYEKKFCEGSEARGLLVLGDSASAHFHIPPEWLIAAHMSLKTFSNLPMALSNELDWPQFSGTTGFLNSTSGFPDHSIYLRLRQRNRCNHRDYQNISKNGASSKNLLKFMGSLSRNQLLDKPAIVIYTMLGNDVCNENIDTVSKMTTPEAMRAHVMETLTFLNTRLPPGSHVVLYGLADGRFLWDYLHDRYHPLGQLNRDITYEQLYTFLSCLQRAKQLSNVLEMITVSEKFANMSLLYLDYPLKEMSEEWQRRGGETWQLIEPVDGFHPNEVAAQLVAKFFWEKVLQRWPQVLGKENPFNEEIQRLFGDQGGH